LRRQSAARAVRAGRRAAWGLLMTSGQQKWLGNPAAAIQAAINSNLE
jgi:hypothetical protein